jgi:hypothetical protein
MHVYVRSVKVAGKGRLPNDTCEIRKLERDSVVLLMKSRLLRPLVGLTIIVELQILSGPGLAQPIGPHIKVEGSSD